MHPPDIVVRTIDDAIAVAVGREADAALAERVTPEGIVGRVNRADLIQSPATPPTEITPVVSSWLVSQVRPPPSKGTLDRTKSAADRAPIENVKRLARHRSEAICRDEQFTCQCEIPARHDRAKLAAANGPTQSNAEHARWIERCGADTERAAIDVHKTEVFERSGHDIAAIDRKSTQWADR